MLHGLETVIYCADDLAAASAWYRDALAAAPNYEAPHYVGFTVAGHELGIVPGGRPPTNGQVAYWSVGDVAAAIAHFVEHGAVEHAAPREVGGGIVVGSVLDPFGNVIGLIANPLSPNSRT